MQNTLADPHRSPVLKQVHPDTGISNRAMSILNSFVNGKPPLTPRRRAWSRDQTRHTKPEATAY